MKKILFLLSFIPLVSFGQERTVTDLGVETIRYGQVAKYVYDGNPFNDNEKSLTIFPDTQNKNETFYTMDGQFLHYGNFKGLNFLYVSKSDLEQKKLLSN